jgi:ribosome maturation factor RimP
MLNQELIETVSRRVEALIESDPTLFLVKVWIKPTLNIRVYIDGDQGVSVDRLIKFNRALYRQLVEEGVLPDGEFSLEFSSPGLDEPLKLHRQYVKNIGRQVEVVTLEGVQVVGKLTGVTETGFTVEEVKGKGKKQEVKSHEWAFNEIKATTMQITF